MRNLFKVSCYILLPFFTGVYGVCHLVTDGPSLTLQQVRVIGSSAVFPFAATVAERFAFHEHVPTPVVESVGTGVGFKVFCSGSGHSYPDVLTASRPISQGERQHCKSKRIGDLYEIVLGYDGIALILSHKEKTFSLTPEQIYLALAEKVPVGGKLIKNPASTWKDVDPYLPPLNIRILGPSPTSGTRDTFTEKVLKPGCTVVGEYFHDNLDCQRIRTDGAYVDIGANENMIIQKVVTSPGAIGIVSYSFLDQNRNQVQSLSINGILPTPQSVQDNRYILSRPLYIYAKKEREAASPELGEFIKEFTLDQVSGVDGYLTKRGLIALPPEEHAKQRKTIEAGIPQIKLKEGP